MGLWILGLSRAVECSCTGFVLMCMRLVLVEIVHGSDREVRAKSEVNV